MKKDVDYAKLRAILAFIGLACMSVFTPLLIAIFAYPSLAKGVLGWLALVTGLIGIGTCIAVRFVFKGDKKKKPSYLPEGADDPEDDADTEGEKPSKGKKRKKGKRESQAEDGDTDKADGRDDTEQPREAE